MDSLRNQWVVAQTLQTRLAFDSINDTELDKPAEENDDEHV
jgi:hypothetical protein